MTSCANALERSPRRRVGALMFYSAGGSFDEPHKNDLTGGEARGPWSRQPQARDLELPRSHCQWALNDRRSLDFVSNQITRWFPVPRPVPGTA